MADNGQDIELENVNPAVIPSESEQDFFRRVWIEGLAEMLAETKSRWEDAFRTVKSEATAAVAELRASIGEVRVSMELPLSVSFYCHGQVLITALAGGLAAGSYA